jgi:hypothetical protein
MSAHASPAAAPRPTEIAAPRLAEIAAPRPAEIHGLVDNATARHLHGWAWNAAQPEERVVVELRLGDTLVATTVAEQLRPDLAPAGIGDGRHAFGLALQPEWLERQAELSVLCRAADGTEAPLAIRVRRADADPAGTLQKVLEASGKAHRELRQDLGRLASRLPPETAQLGEQLRALNEGQATLDARLETLALWLARLDERLAALPSAAPPVAPARGLDAWQWVLGGVLGVVLLGAGLVTVALLRGAG